MSCTRGLGCPDVALPYRGWKDCTADESCDACAGRITWVCGS
ncbi:hypothetical protein ACFV0C_04450 [Streptomyces sp. NPDC059568]